MMPRMICFCIMAAMGVAGPLWAETYEWTDNKGVVNFTDDLDKVPAKYRNKARERESIKIEQEETLSPVDSVPVMKPVDSVPSLVPAVPVQGEHNQRWWQERFASLRNEIKSIESILAEEREQLTQLKRKRVIYQRTRDRIAYNEMNAKIKNDEAKLKEVQDRLKALDEEADRSGVPQQWRQ